MTNWVYNYFVKTLLILVCLPYDNLAGPLPSHWSLMFLQLMPCGHLTSGIWNKDQHPGALAPSEALACYLVPILFGVEVCVQPPCWFISDREVVIHGSSTSAKAMWFLSRKMQHDVSVLSNPLNPSHTPGPRGFACKWRDCLLMSLAGTQPSVMQFPTLWEASVNATDFKSPFSDVDRACLILKQQALHTPLVFRV